MRFATAAAVAATLCLMLASPAGAEITATHLDSDSELLEYLSDTLFVSEGRIGDRGGAATFELDLGDDTGAPAATEQYDWQNGAAEPFSVNYDHETGTVTFTLGGKVLHFVTGFADFDALFIRGRAVDDGSSVSVDNIQINGEIIDDAVMAAGSGNGLDILLIYGVYLMDGFNLSGTATMNWTGDPPAQSRLAFQVKVARSSVVDTEESSWGAVKSMYR